MAARARRFVRLALGVGLALVLAESALRFVLFAPLARAWGLGWSVRREGLYTAYQSGREFWLLRARLASEPPSAAAQYLDERVGWLGDRFDRDLVHVDEPGLGARTPVLLFGDSYAHCVEPAESCWQGQLERSELGPRFALLNYGVGGYGLDQTYLLMRLVLPRFQARAPVVVIGILVDDDLDRCYLALRDAPKPYFTLQDGELTLHPPEADTPSFLRAHPLEIKSYLWRLFTFHSGLVAPETAIAWAGEGDHVAVKQALGARLLLEMRRELDDRGLRTFVVLFHARRSLSVPEGQEWQERFLLETLRREAIPFVSSRRALSADMQRTGAEPASYFYPGGAGANHYTAAANAIVFAALRDGLEGRFEAEQR